MKWNAALGLWGSGALYGVGLYIVSMGIETDRATDQTKLSLPACRNWSRHIQCVELCRIKLRDFLLVGGSGVGGTEQTEPGASSSHAITSSEHSL